MGQIRFPPLLLSRRPVPSSPISPDADDHKWGRIPLVWLTCFAHAGDMSYRSLQHANRVYEFTVFGVLIGAFLVAMLLMFVHPTGAITIFWIGLILLAITVVVERVVRQIQRSTARKALRAQVCPNCDARISQDQNDGTKWQCQACGSIFLENGAEQPPSL